MNDLPSRQFEFLAHELKLMINGRWWRAISIWFASATWILVTYRFERFMFLRLGRIYGLLRLFLLPFLFLTRPWRSNCELHYRADIGRGLKLLHPELGIVINGNAIVGDHLTLTGGNCIGGRAHLQQGDIRIGENVLLGANAVVLGPLRIGSNVTIGAGAVVIHDADDGATLAGVPARPITSLTLN